MPFIDLEHLESRELIPGYHARFLHTDHLTLAYWTVDQGARMPEHQHPHEQVSNLIEGQFELTVDGETQLLNPGIAALVAPNIRHSGRAITCCRLIDAFYPVREDYR